MQHGRCPEHQQQVRQYEVRFQKGLYGRRWRKARARFLSQPEHALCIDCKQEGFITLAAEVDHVIPHRGDSVLFWDESNWAGRCRRHHSAKTAREVWGDKK